MTTTISPSVGQGSSFLQAGPGASPGYGAIDIRRALGAHALQEGVMTSGAFKVTQRAAGANMSVDIAASDAGGAWVQGDAITAQGLYFVAPHSAAINEAIATADASNPRLDQVILEAKDDTHDAGGLNLARVRVVSGTPTSGATLDNRNGAASLPSGAIRLADVLVAASDTSITTAEIRDRRPWARGAHSRLKLTSGDLTTTSTSLTEISSGLRARIECSGAPIRVRLRSSAWNSGTNQISIAPWIDGALADSIGTAIFEWIEPTANFTGPVGVDYQYTPSAGSHLLSWAWKVSAGTGNFRSSTNFPAIATVEELVRQDATND